MEKGSRGPGFKGPSERRGSKNLKSYLGINPIFLGDTARYENPPPSPSQGEVRGGGEKRS
jgi:hypothetical protein